MSSAPKKRYFGTLTKLFVTGTSLVAKRSRLTPTFGEEYNYFLGRMAFYDKNEYNFYRRRGA